MDSTFPRIAFFFCKQAGISCLVLFHLLHFGFQVLFFHPKKLIIILDARFECARGRNLVVQKEGNRVFSPRNYWLIGALDTSLLGLISTGH